MNKVSLLCNTCCTVYVRSQDLVSNMLSEASEIQGIFNSTLGHSEKGWQTSVVTQKYEQLAHIQRLNVF